MVVVYSEEEKEARVLKNIHCHGFTGFSKEEYNSFISTHPFYKDYDKTPELREDHDALMAEWREQRDRELRLNEKVHSVSNPEIASKSKTDREKWKDLEDNYPLEPENTANGFYNGVPILQYGGRLRATEKTSIIDKTIRTFIREDGNIGVVLNRERVKPSDAYFACQGMLSNLTEAQLKQREENIRRMELNG